MGDLTSAASEVGRGVSSPEEVEGIASLCTFMFLRSTGCDVVG